MQTAASSSSNEANCIRHLYSDDIFCIVNEVRWLKVNLRELFHHTTTMYRIRFETKVFQWHGICTKQSHETI